MSSKNQLVKKKGYMGVLHALVCDKCKVWIDLYKCYLFCRILDIDYEKDFKFYLNDYWTDRGFWFFGKHLKHGDKIRFIQDISYEEYEKMENEYNQIFPATEYFDNITHDHSNERELALKQACEILHKIKNGSIWNQRLRIMIINEILSLKDRK
jgi:hypothetical protein